MESAPINVQRSLIIPVFKNEENIPDLLKGLRKLNETLGPGFEVVFVEDGSPDSSFTILREALPKEPYATQLIALSRNFGSFSAIRVGLQHARGEVFAVLSADMQEPLELIEKFFTLLSNDEADVVFGWREGRDDPWCSRIFAKIFWSLYRRFVLPDIPEGGVDVFACGRRVREAVLKIEEVNSSLLAQLFWVGFRRVFVPYRRLKRQKGKSSWSLGKRLKYMLDSIFSFTDLPIMITLILGGLGILFSMSLGLIIFVMRMLEMVAVPGYTALLLVILFTFSLTLATQGILGCYIWRAMENSKHRPLTIIRATEQWAGYQEKKND